MNDTSPTPTRPQDFRLGTQWICPATNEIDGVRVDAKTMDVLVALASSVSNVMSVAQLLERVWPNVVVGDNVVHQAIAHLRKAVGDNPRAPRYVQSIPKRGYRLIAPVAPMPAGSVERIAQESTGARNASAAFATQSPRGPASLESSVALAPVAHTSAVHRLLAVLAFDNLSGDPDLAFFSDGVSEEIRDTVARSADLKVVGRASSFQFRGADKAAANIATQLNATHVLDGAVRRSGPRVRISTELVECATATTLWSARFDRDLTDIFALQDEIASAVARALKLAFVPSRDSAAIEVAGFDLYLRARAAATDIFGAYDTNLLEAAVAREPRLTQAWAALALSLAIEAQEWPRTLPRPATEVANIRLRAQQAAERAFKLDPNAAHAHAALDALAPIAGAFALREAHLRRALAAAPDDPFVLGRMSLWCQNVGRYQESLVYATRAFEIDPLIPSVNQWYWTTLHSVGRVAEAETLAAAARERWPDLDHIANPPLMWAAHAADWPLAERLLADIRTRGPHSPQIAAHIQRVERMQEGFSVVGLELLSLLRQQLSNRRTVALGVAELACTFGFAREVYPILVEASFAHLFEPAGRLPRSDASGLYVLFDRWPSPGAMTRDIRFVQLCARLGLCDYWVQSDTWPDCADQVDYDFRGEARRFVTRGV